MWCVPNSKAKLKVVFWCFTASKIVQNCSQLFYQPPGRHFFIPVMIDCSQGQVMEWCVLMKPGWRRGCRNAHALTFPPLFNSRTVHLESKRLSFDDHYSCQRKVQSCSWNCACAQTSCLCWNIWLVGGWNFLNKWINEHSELKISIE